MDMWVTLAALALVLAGAVLRAVTLDFVSIAAVVVLVVGGVLDVADATAGFGNPTLLAVACMFVLAEALQRTGAADGLGRLVQRKAADGSRALLFALLPIVMVLSGVMSNTGVVVLLLPILVGASQAAGTSPSRLLLPLSYASITGGTLTLVGTTTTLLVDAMLRDANHPGIGLIEIMPIGAVFCVIAFVYLIVASPKVLPDRMGLVTPIDASATRQYVTELVLAPRSRLIGQTLRMRDDGLRPLLLLRGEQVFWPPFDEVSLESGDVLRVKGTPDEIVEVLHQPGIELPSVPDDEDLVRGRDVALAELMIAPGSSFIGRTVRGAALRDRFGALVLAVQRRGEHIREGITELSLQLGDILLVQGTPDALERMGRGDDDLIAIGGTPPEPPRRAKRWAAIGIVGIALGMAALNIMPLVVATLVAAAALVVSRCISAPEAYRSLDLRILVVLGCMLALGRAAQTSGLAAAIADGLIHAADHMGSIGPRGLLAMIYLATLILTELVTNAGTAGLMLPIALQVAERAGVSDRPFVFAVALAASCSFLTPVGYQTNLLVYGPGGYRLSDYLRLGAPLSLLLWIAAVLLLPVVYPFHPM